MTRFLAVNVVGLTPRLLDSGHMPQLSSFARAHTVRYLLPDLPAVTCTSQAGMLTGVPPSQHGAVANGWYFKNLAEIWLWRQSVHLLQTPTIFDHWRKKYPNQKTAQVFWWWCLPSQADLSLTPRPTYWADGRKDEDVHSSPPGLRHRLNQKLGYFPLFRFWGPAAGIQSSRWITSATLDILQEDQPDLCMVYLPHLDYDLQRFGPESQEAMAAAAAIDAELGRLIEYCQGAHVTPIFVSEYGITPVSKAVHINQAFRQAGMLEIHPARNGALLDPGNSRAFAVCDHQCAHIYVSNSQDLPSVYRILQQLDGIQEIYDEKEQVRIGIRHERSGQFFCLSEPDAWFAYPYWSDTDREPDFARTVEIHKKPGYDPCELFLDPKIPAVKFQIARKLIGKKLGIRTLMNLIPLDTSLVRGSHGRLPQKPEDGPLWIGSEEWAPEPQPAPIHQALKKLWE